MNTASTIQDVITSDTSLGKIMDNWFPLVRRYAGAWKDEKTSAWKEVHWWYRKRTHVGMFAGAVWMAGGIALEEYGSEKLKRFGKSDTKYKGRSDLYFGIMGRHFDLEAKHVYLDLPQKEQVVSLDPLITALREACKNACQRPKAKASCRLGGVFGICPARS